MVFQHSLVPSAASQPEPRQSAWHSLHLRGQGHRRLLRWCRGGLSTLPCLRPGLRIRGEWFLISIIMRVIIFPLNNIAIGGQGRLTSLKSMNKLFLGTDQWIVRLEHYGWNWLKFGQKLPRAICHKNVPKMMILTQVNIYPMKFSWFQLISADFDCFYKFWL